MEQTTTEAKTEFSRFDEWWEPFTLGVGPAGAYAKKLETRRAAGCAIAAGTSYEARSP